jgi:hypothetical protein
MLSHSSEKLLMTSLSQQVEQPLLADIENTGLPLDQVSLIATCNGIYGAPGKSCWPVQLQFQMIRELTAPHGYRKLLVKHTTTPGPAALVAEQQEQEAQELPDQDTTQDADEELGRGDDHT